MSAKIENVTESGTEVFIPLAAGAAAGTGLAVGGAALAAGGSAVLAARGGVAGLSGGAAAVRGSAVATGAAWSAYTAGSTEQPGATGVASGLGGVARAAGSAAASPLRRVAARATDRVKSSFSEGARAGFAATGGTSTVGTTRSDPGPPPASAAATGDGPSAWAQRLQRGGHVVHGVRAAAHAIRSGDSHGSGASVNLSEGDRS
jgi:type IV secretion system protein TrbL